MRVLFLPLELLDKKHMRTEWSQGDYSRHQLTSVFSKCTVSELFTEYLKGGVLKFLLFGKSLFDMESRPNWRINDKFTDIFRLENDRGKLKMLSKSKYICRHLIQDCIVKLKINVYLSFRAKVQDLFNQLYATSRTDSSSVSSTSRETLKVFWNCESHYKELGPVCYCQVIEESACTIIRTPCNQWVI